MRIKTILFSAIVFFAASIAPAIAQSNIPDMPVINIPKMPEIREIKPEAEPFDAELWGMILAIPSIAIGYLIYRRLTKKSTIKSIADIATPESKIYVNASERPQATKLMLKVFLLSLAFVSLIVVIGLFIMSKLPPTNPGDMDAVDAQVALFVVPTFLIIIGFVIIMRKSRMVKSQQDLLTAVVDSPSGLFFIRYWSNAGTTIGVPVIGPALAAAIATHDLIKIDKGDFGTLEFAAWQIEKVLDIKESEHDLIVRVYGYKHQNGRVNRGLKTYKLSIPKNYENFSACLEAIKRRS